MKRPAPSSSSSIDAFLSPTGSTTTTTGTGTSGIATSIASSSSFDQQHQQQHQRQNAHDINYGTATIPATSSSTATATRTATTSSTTFSGGARSNFNATVNARQVTGGGLFLSSGGGGNHMESMSCFSSFCKKDDIGFPRGMNASSFWGNNTPSKVAKTTSTIEDEFDDFMGKSSLYPSPSTTTSNKRSKSPRTSSLSSPAGVSTTTTTTTSATTGSLSSMQIPEEETDKYLGAELARMSLQERDKITEDIHGIAQVIEETTEFVQIQLDEFDKEITKLRNRHRRTPNSTLTSAYEKALFLNPQLVQYRTDFKLLFLRADQFDAQKAALRIMQYFSVKLELFGPDKLVKQPITLEDLDLPDDQECLYSGGIQPLPIKDRSGRRIVMIFPKHTPMGNSIGFFRSMFYIYMAAVEQDVEVQRRGLVEIFYFIGGESGHMSNAKNPYAHPNTLRLSKELLGCLPYRTVAMHAIYDDAMIKPFFYVLPIIIPKFRLVRFRFHFGSHLEASYTIKTFGIPAERFPLDAREGKYLDNEWFHSEYLKNQKEAEKEMTQQQQQQQQVGSDNQGGPVFVIPNSLDVLLGRGRPFQEHSGNVRLAALIDLHRSKYEDAGSTYGRKNIICENVVDIIHESHGRFLKQIIGENGNPTGWEVVSLEVARDKVSHGFRTQKRLKPSPAPSSN